MSRELEQCTALISKGTVWDRETDWGKGGAFTDIKMAPHSSTLAWKIPWTEEPGRLQSMGSLRVGQDWATSLSLFTFMHWRRKWQPTPVFLPGECQGRGSLVGCRLWGHTKSDTTEVTKQHDMGRISKEEGYCFCLLNCYKSLKKLPRNTNIQNIYCVWSVMEFWNWEKLVVISIYPSL